MAKSTETPFTRDIREACSKAGISIREFLRRTNLPTSALYRWETGHVPRRATVDLVNGVLKEMEDGS